MTPLKRSRGPSLPSGVWALGLVSLCMDISSEMIHSLLPAFLVTTLGVSALTLGAIEGIAEATAAFTKLVSGALSDHFRQRTPLLVVGYGLAALTKPLFPLADSALMVFIARIVDRLGKGIRGAPRDALVRDLTPPAQRGAAYGLRQSLDTVGAFVGPLLAVALMVTTGNDIRRVFWFAVAPALVAVAVLVGAVRDPPAADGDHDGSAPALTWRRFPAQLWLLVGVVATLTLTRFSEAFLVLRAQENGWPLAALPLVLVVMNLAYAASAYPAGRLSDALPRRDVLMVGCGVMALADICLAVGGSAVILIVGVALWGVHMGLTEGLLAALVADYTPAALTGTAFGIVNLARGVMLLFASVLAGALWTSLGPPATFLAGIGFAGLTVVALLGLPRCTSV